MKSESPVKKHHFWILLGLVPLFTLIAVFMVSSSVGGQINKRQDEIKAASTAIASKTNPKPEKLLRDLDKSVEKVSGKLGDFHKDNWERQQSSEWGPVRANGKRDKVFTWPGNSSVFKELEQKNLKFGDPIPDLQAVFSDFQIPTTYQHEYSSLKKDGTGTGTGMADRIAPTQFRGGWQTVLRHVDNFGQVNITKDQVWLILEDMWVQRSLLEGIRSVNAEMATFERVKYEKDGSVIDDPASKTTQNNTKRLFRNRTWELALEIVKEGTSSHRLTGTLTNISDRLQLMGNGNMMTLNVWLDKNGTAQPMVFRIGGELLPGRGAMKTVKVDGAEKTVPANVLNIVPLDEHILSDGSTATWEISRVEQVFDARTVPIKRLDALVIGHKDALDSRNVERPLQLPKFIEEKEPATKTDTQPSGMPPLGPPGGVVPGVGVPGKGVGPVGPGYPGSGQGQGQGGLGQRSGGGSLATAINANKKRYVDVTPQVRRMPVGIVVIVDQAYMQDVLLAFSNSPLRFQITQVTWKRFRDKLDGVGGGSGGAGENLDYGYGGMIGSGLKGSADPDAPSSGLSPRPMSPSVGIFVPPGSVGTPPGSVGLPTYPGVGGYPGTGSFGGQATVSDSQITSGLVELSIYGIVSLYEKYEAPKVDTATPPTPPAPNTPAPQPGVPMNPAPVVPKPRRRVRV